ncbi:Shikimate kinase [Rippkaea orientalis PCC 8801]|uniref:Shikimate kinase n=1 Tax=Rippkaea orientalis (strain PCC 8801 / RF-1) TaxID=41431 RepID=AROK_RIPO1|nr:shikimate kinase [Rippkaea orientalis]B7JZT6.1 RecName: Full=Shikimate kinase; Short=SK [Rippkaea orientalis PCC 8801]ACK65029.1 Shikimate kinase [Rippkaea orientalis PCC 8801]
MKTQKLLQGINIYLIGMMGSGKSTIGKILAQRLDYRFFDTDILIERVTQQSINDIFVTQGETVFRDIETQVLSEVAACTRSVIATGGGIVLNSQNWSYLHHGLIIWLDVSIKLLKTRLINDTTRPLLKESDLTLKLKTLDEQRRNLYNKADLTIVINQNRTPESIVSEILEAIPTVIKPKVEANQFN